MAKNLTKDLPGQEKHNLVQETAIQLLQKGFIDTIYGDNIVLPGGEIYYQNISNDNRLIASPPNTFKPQWKFKARKS